MTLERVAQGDHPPPQEGWLGSGGPTLGVNLGVQNFFRRFTSKREENHPVLTWPDPPLYRVLFWHFLRFYISGRHEQGVICASSCLFLNQVV